MEHVESEIPAKLFDRALLSRMLRYVRPYAGWVLLAAALVVPIAALANSLPLIIRDATDHALLGDHLPVDERWALVLRAAGMFALIAFGGFLLRAGQSYLLSWLGQRMLLDMRADIFNKILRLPFRYFDRQPVGRLMTRVGSDVEAMQRLLTDGLVGLTTDLLMLAAVLVYMFRVNVRLAAIMALLLPAMLAALLVLNARVRSAHREVRRRQASLNSNLQESIAGMSTIQLFNREKHAEWRFESHNAALRGAFLQSVKWYSLAFPATEIMGAIAAVLVLGAGSWMAWHSGSPTIGELIAFLAYVREFFRPLDDLSEKSNVLQAAMASGERVFALLDTPEEISDPPNPTPLPSPFRGEIRFDRVWFAYDGNHWVLRDVSVDIPAGQSVAIVGATGSGKSTLTALIARFYDVQRGAVYVDGVDVRACRIADLRSRIGVVLQDPFIFAGTLAENISLFDPEMPRERIEEAARFVNAHAFISKRDGGYDALVTERGAGLSTGQKQLIALARAIAHNPDILLILDEATANVDTETERLIQDALNKVMRGRTTIIIAHRLSTIRHADRILVMRHGQIVEQGTHADLLAINGYYRRLYELLSHEKMPGLSKA